MPNQYTEQDYTHRDSQKEQDWNDNLDTDYIFANEDAEADAANLQGNSDLGNANKERRINPLGFGGKINRIFQIIFNRLNWLKANAGGDPPDADTETKGIVQRITNAVAALGIDSTRYTTIASILHALRNGEIFEATEDRKGVSQRASQADVNTGTEDEEFVTPATFRDSEVIQSVLPKSTSGLAFRGRSTDSPMSYTAEVVGNLGIFKITVSGTSYTEFRIEQSGSSYWMLMSVEDLIAYNTSRNEIARMSVTNINYNNNGSVIRIASSGRFSNNEPVANGDIFYLYMVKVR